MVDLAARLLAEEGFFSYAPILLNYANQHVGSILVEGVIPKGGAGGQGGPFYIRKKNYSPKIENRKNENWVIPKGRWQSTLETANLCM
jgi:hypothetical protein